MEENYQNETVAPVNFDNDKNNQKNKIINHKEYALKLNNNDYILRIEIDNIYITFIVTKLDETVLYNYRNKYDLNSIVDKLDLNPSRHSNLNIILNIIDQVYSKKKLFLSMDDDNTMKILIKFNVIFEEITHELILYKIYMNTDDKFNILYNEIKTMQNNFIAMTNKKDEEIMELKLKLNEMINNLNKKNEEIENFQNLIYEKDKIIDEINGKLKDQEIKIAEINQKLIEHFNNLKNTNNIILEKDVAIKDLNKKLKNKDTTDIENINNIRNYINEINNYSNEKYKELTNLICILGYNDFIKKINYKFDKDPQNLTFKFNINNTNASYGWNDVFEVYTSCRDNREYLVSPNNDNYRLDIIALLDNKLILSLKGHDNHIRTIRYFMNNNNHNEYLISADNEYIVIVWEITNNYNMKYKIATEYGDNIYSCLLLFDLFNDKNYIITSTYCQSDENEKSATKIYSLDNGQFIKLFEKTGKSAIYYLLSWYNQKNNKYYIIQFAFKEIIITNLLEDELYSEFMNEPEDNHLSGFIYQKENIDYLVTSSYNGYINIWDLYEKKINKVINTNECVLCHIIEWNNKYSIVADYNNKSFKIIDIEEGKLVKDIGGQHTDKVACVKKINHPVYGEALLTAGQDHTIKLWIL